MSALNVQHDCHSGECAEYEQVPVRQERELTSVFRTILDHSDTPMYILNTHSLHNYSIIACILPNSLASVLYRPVIPSE